jgi:carbamoyltransferase
MPADCSLIQIPDIVGKPQSHRIGIPGSISADIAYAAQTDFEQRLWEFLKNLHTLIRSENVVLTGDRALNSLANGKVLRNTGFKSMYVPCMPSTPGDAIGAALLAYRDDNPEWRANFHTSVQTPYLGSSIVSREVPDRIIGSGLYDLHDCDGSACTEAASLLSRGLVVAWVQGRSEFALQSLGNRSILADPRRADLRDRLESLTVDRDDIALPRVSVLHEYGAECVDHYQVSPYMERALQLRAKFVRRVPGLGGKEGIVRIHTVRRDWNERFYDLICCFYRLTGVPMIVNLNCGFPGRRFVRTVDDILVVLSRGEVDAIFVEELMVTRMRHDISGDHRRTSVAEKTRRLSSEVPFSCSSL